MLKKLTQNILINVVILACTIVENDLQTVSRSTPYNFFQKAQKY